MILDSELLGITETSAELTEYTRCWDYQYQVHAQVVNQEILPRIIYVQHQSVYTAGRSTQPAELAGVSEPVLEVDRGGKITWHGPGQLTGYPIVTLPGQVGALDFVRRVEEAIIRYLATLGLVTGRIPGRTGVWLAADEARPERKICAIGIKVAKRTTMHGFGLNVSPELSHFDRIVPCGISDASVTSIATELGQAPSLYQVATELHPFFVSCTNLTEPIELTPDLDRGPWAPNRIPQQVRPTTGLTRLTPSTSSTH